MKLLSIAVPCYNSQDYMERCIDSLLVGGTQIEIIIIDDGSCDNTADIAENYRKKYPDTVHVISKKNGGHGSAVNAGLKAAKGMFFKVVDSDDYVNAVAYKKALKVLSEYSQDSKGQLDMLVCNYVYDNIAENKQRSMRYKGFMPENTVFGWKDLRYPHKGKYLLMHSAIFRTELLRKCSLKLPENTFYVDEIFIFEPLFYVKSVYYLNADFYYYVVGRAGQSVHEDIMISRIDQQIKVNKRLISYFAANCCKIEEYVQLKRYMRNYLEIITTVSSILLIRSGTKENLEKKKKLWRYIRWKDVSLYRWLRLGIMGTAVNLPGRLGRSITSGGYFLFRKIWHFN